MSASMYGDEEVTYELRLDRIQRLFERYMPQGRDLELKRNALHVAMLHKAPAADVQQLLDTEIDLADRQDQEGLTPLHIGAQVGAPLDSMRVAINASPIAATVPSSEGFLPLHLALHERSSLPVVVCILEAFKSAAEAKTTYDFLPLHMAMLNRAPPDCVRAVLNVYPKATREVSTAGYTAFHVGLRYNANLDGILAVFEKNLEAAEVIAYNGTTPLHDAVKYSRNIEFITQLAHIHPAAISKQDNETQRTPLHMAILCGSSVQALEVLLGADPSSASIVDSEERTALHMACERGAPATIIRLLIERFPQAAEAPDIDGNTPLHLVMMNRNTSLDAIRIILEQNQSISLMKNNDERTPLHVGMAFQASENAIKFLLNEAPEAAGMRDKAGRSPLHLKICSVDVDEDESGRPFYIESLTIMEAALISFPNAISFLDNNGHTPLYELICALNGKKASDNQNMAQSDADNVAIEYETRTIQRLFEAYPMAAETYCPSGASSLSILISECARAKSNVHLTRTDSCRRLKMLLKESRDARLLKPLCTLRNIMPLMAFFLLFDDQDLVQPLINWTPTINPNKQVLCRWTFLEILADYDTKDSTELLLQIVRWQQSQSADENEPLTPLKIFDQDRSYMEVKLQERISERTLTKVADRAKLSVNSVELRVWGQEYGRFLKQYRLDDQPKHISETCVVVFGSEAHSGRNGETLESRVACKFMCDKDAFEREISKRKYIKESGYVMPIKAVYANDGASIDCSHVEHRFGIDLERELAPYPKIRLQPNHNGDSHKLLYLIVMEAGAGVDLHDYIGHQNIAGKNVSAVTSIAYGIAECLRFLNEECGILHGDCKARNFVLKGIGLNFAAIDLDNASSITQMEMAGHKRTSSGYLPPEQAAIVAHQRLMDREFMFSSSSVCSEQDTLKEQLWKALSKDEMKEARMLLQSLETVRFSENCTSCAPGEVIATSKYDMWSFGVLLYYLCTGRQLFNVDLKEDVKLDDLLQLAEWNNDVRDQLLADVHHAFPRELLKSLLDRNPRNRPKDWQVIIDSLKSVSPVSVLRSDQIIVLQAAPLCFRYKKRTIHVPRLGIKNEADNLKHALHKTMIDGNTIDISFDIASTDTLSACFTQKSCSVLHLSFHTHKFGSKHKILLEAADGEAKPLRMDQLRDLLPPRGKSLNMLKLVFLSSCYSEDAGRVLVTAGVPHVVCCERQEEMNDIAATEFASHFYRALACRNTLQQSFDQARRAVGESARVHNARYEAQKFKLLPPEATAGSGYHDVQIFYQSTFPVKHEIPDPAPPVVESLPPITNDECIGGQESMFNLLCCIKDSRIICVDGKPGVGKSNIVARTCDFMLYRRTQYPVEHVIFATANPSLIPSSNPISQNVSRILAMLLTSGPGFKSTKEYFHCMSAVIDGLGMSGLGLLVIDEPRFRTTQSVQNLRLFLDDILRGAGGVKIIFILPSNIDNLQEVYRDFNFSVRISRLEVRPLDLQHSITLFSRYLLFHLKGQLPSRSIKEFREALMPPKNGGDNFEQESALHERIGNGIPREMDRIAQEMTTAQAVELMHWWTPRAPQQPTGPAAPSGRYI